MYLVLQAILFTCCFFIPKQYGGDRRVWSTRLACILYEHLIISFICVVQNHNIINIINNDYMIPCERSTAATPPTTATSSTAATLSAIPSIKFYCQIYKTHPKNLFYQNSWAKWLRQDWNPLAKINVTCLFQIVTVWMNISVLIH